VSEESSKACSRTDVEGCENCRHEPFCPIAMARKEKEEREKRHGRGNLLTFWGFNKTLVICPECRTEIRVKKEE
jgi:hypothetical protein